MSESAENDGNPPTGILLLCIPLGLAIWFVPLYMAETIGILNSLAIIFGIITVFVILSKLGEAVHSKEDTQPPTKEQKTYTV